MQILARKTGTITIFDVSGQINFANSPQVRQSLLHEIQESRTPCVMVISAMCATSIARASLHWSKH